MSYHDTVSALAADAEQLERVYQTALKAGEADAFKQAIDASYTADPENLLRYHNLGESQAFFDENNMLRANTRLSESSLLPPQTKFPHILPKKSYLTRLLVLDVHRTFGHLSKQATSFRLKLQFRLMGGGRELANILSKCDKKGCTKPKPLKQIMAPLPPTRVDAYQPFTNVAVDFAGPFFVNHICTNDLCPHTGKEKVWIVVFSCLTTRALAIQPLRNQSTQSFMETYVITFSSRGYPSTLFSDHSKSLHAASRALKELYSAIDWKELGEQCAVKGTKWEWATPRSPHTHGVVEAAVKAAKKGISAMFSTAVNSYETFRVACAQSESAANDRPLSIKYLEGPDTFSQVTPSMLCLGRLIGNLPIPAAKDPEEDRTSVELIADLQKNRRILMRRFWGAWKRDYLLALGAHKFERKDSDVPLQVGQVVHLMEESLGKRKWCLARIVELHPGRDGRIRRVGLKTQKGIVMRHVTKIALLEGSPTLADQIDFQRKNPEQD